MKAIIVIPTQGFGNRLRMIASSYILAQYMKLEHYILWEQHHDCTLNFDDIWEEHPFRLITKEEFIDSPYIYFGYVHTDAIMNQLLSAKNVDYVILSGGHEFKHPVMEKNEFLHNKYKLYNQLKFKCEDELSFLPSQYACIHIRTVTGKDAKDIVKNDSCNFQQNSPIKEYLALVKKINNDLPLFIISNDLLISKIFQEHFPKKQIFISNPSILNRDTHEGMNSAIRDFTILSKAAFIIGTYYSSFSDEATFFGMIPKIIPLKESLCNKKVYHCVNYEVKNSIGYLNYDNNTIVKYIYSL